MTTTAAPPPALRTPKRRRFAVDQKGWLFVAPFAIVFALVFLAPLVYSLYLSFFREQIVGGNAFVGLDNYFTAFTDTKLWDGFLRVLLFLIIQVPIMLVLAMILANLLNNPNLKAKAFWRTAIFLPAAVSLVSYSLVFRTIFANDGFMNDFLALFSVAPVNWLGEPETARFVLILGLLWRWTGYNMIFFLAGLQNVDRSTIEAARIDGANSFQTFWRVTVPQLKPIILLTAILSTNGTLQLFDESWNLTKGGPAYASMSMSHYLYEVSFQRNPNFGYGAALSYVILILVAVLAFIQLRVGDKRG